MLYACMNIEIPYTVQLIFTNKKCGKKKSFPFRLTFQLSLEVTTNNFSVAFQILPV
jgi:hypothetical protein